MADEFQAARSLGRVLHEIVIPDVRESLAAGDEKRTAQGFDAAFQILDEIIEALPR